MLDSFNIRDLFKRLTHFIERINSKDVEFVYAFIKVIKDPLMQDCRSHQKSGLGFYEFGFKIERVEKLGLFSLSLNFIFTSDLLRIKMSNLQWELLVYKIVVSQNNCYNP